MKLHAVQLGQEIARSGLVVSQYLTEMPDASEGYELFFLASQR